MDTDQGTKVYELGYLLLPSIAEGELSEAVNRLKGLIAKAGGSELASEEPFLIDLAYPMTKVVGASRYVVNDAYIGWVKFEAEGSAVSALRKEVEGMDEVLRALLIKAPRETAFTFAKARAEKAQALAEKAEREALPEAAPEGKEVVVE